MEGRAMKTLRRYRLYVDESGNHKLGAKCEQHLGLLGLVVPFDSYVSSFKPALLAIKRAHFTDDPDSPVILHREEVAQQVGPFATLADADRRREFNEDMVSFYKHQDYALIAVVIDKHSHRDAYGEEARHPYHYCAEAMLERYYFYLAENQGNGDVFAESRGSEQDSLLQAEWRRLCQDGTHYVPRKQIPMRLLSDQIEFRNKGHNVYGLQVADMLAKVALRDVLVAHGHADRFRSSFEQRVAESISEKYRRSAKGIVAGYGKKLLHAQKKPAPNRERLVSTGLPLPEGRATTPEGAVRE
jgi:hypothetical protein